MKWPKYRPDCGGYVIEDLELVAEILDFIKVSERLEIGL